MEQPHIAWTPVLAIGDTAIDTQHQRLMRLIGQIVDGSGTASALSLNAAVEYAATHFKAEEELMRRTGYPGLAAHQVLHQRLTHNLMGYVKKVEKGETDLLAFKNFMFAWVRDHIMGEDQKIGVFLRRARAAQDS